MENIKICLDENEEYHSKTQYLSSSGLKTIAKKSVSHFLYQAPPTGNALLVGTAFHTLVLENEKFDDEFMIMPKIDRRTKAGKAQYAIFNKEAAEAGKMVLGQEDYDLVSEMAKSVRVHPIYQKMLDSCNREYSIYIDDFTIPECGDYKFRVRVRPDAYFRGEMDLGIEGQPSLQNFVVDLKSCQDSSPTSFKRDIFRFAWHIQAAFYLDLLTHVAKSLGTDQEFKDFYFLAVEKSAPFMPQLYRLNDDLVSEGRKMYRKGLMMWREYLEENTVQGFHNGDDMPSFVLEI